jgi:hypothetical protein
MSEHLQVVLDVLTGEVSYRFSWRKLATTKTTPELGDLPESVLRPAQTLQRAQAA